jgi:hypothetical protein
MGGKEIHCPKWLKMLMLLAELERLSNSFAMLAGEIADMLDAEITDNPLSTEGGW